MNNPCSESLSIQDLNEDPWSKEVKSRSTIFKEEETVRFDDLSF